MENTFIPVPQIIANRIKDMIFLDKIYKPNDRLPNEYDLSVQLKVSRTSLREAIKILVTDGVLTVKRGSGTYVSAFPDGKKTPFGLGYLEDKKKLVKNWFEFRLIFEPPMARLAAENGNDEEILEIVNSSKKIKSLVAAGQDFLEEDQHFHAIIAKATHNDILRLALPSLENAVRDTLNISTKLGYINLSAINAAAFHPSIANFIAHKDGYGAELAMRYHILRGIEDFNNSQF